MAFFTALWNWLYANNFVKDVIATAVALTGAHVSLWRPFKLLKKNQDVIADRLDTATPGGLGDLVQQKDDAHDPPRHAPVGPPPRRPQR